MTEKLLKEIDAFIIENHPQQAIKQIETYLFTNNAQEESSAIVVARIYYLLGVCQRKEGELDRAKQALMASITLNPCDAEAQFTLANVNKSLNEYAEAETCYLKVISLDATHAKAFFNLGIVYQMTERLPQAISAYQTATRLNPEYPEALNNLGNAYKSTRRFEQAITCFEQAIRIKALPDTYYNLGQTLQQLKQSDLALEAYHQATLLKPDYLNAWLSLALLLQKKGKYTLAIQAFNQAILLSPDNAEIYYNLALTFTKMKLLEPAVAAYAKSLAINPNYTEALGSLIQTKMHACDWERLTQLFDALALNIQQQRGVVPFNLLATPLSAALQKQCAENYTHKSYPTQSPLTDHKTRYSHQKIKVAYFSADFHNHATAYLMADLFATHDRQNFEIIAFSFGPVQDDEMARVVRERFDQFYAVNHLSDIEIAKLAVSLEIDIAVDLKGYTRGARPMIFAYKPAPVIVSYLGYPGTLGAEYFDYIIADQTLIPPQHQQYYSEKIAYMPDTYQVNAQREVLPPAVMSRNQHGLPDKAFVFASFNNNFKITPDVFEIWMRLLNKTPNSILWLFEANPSATKHLSAYAEKVGVEKERLVFAKKVSQAEHLNRYHYADLVLDTFYYNAHTTTSDALWVGCPVITCIGQTFPSRVAASLLKAHGMPELITESPQAYEALALKLAQQPEQLQSLRAKILTHKTTHPLFDIKKYTEHLEQLYFQMHQRYNAGQPIANLHAA